MNLARWLDRAARADPSAIAVYRGDKPWADYADLAARAARLAAGLRDKARLAPGDRVGIFMGNSPEYLEAMYGIWWAGLAAVPINAKLHPREVAYIRENAGARVLIDSPGAVAALRGDHAAPLHDLDGGEMAWLFYTSGTTGRPKGAMLSHRNLAAMTFSYFVDVDGVDARRPPAARGAAVARLGPVQLHAPRQGRGAGHSRERRLRCGRGAARCSSGTATCRSSPRPRSSSAWPMPRSRPGRAASGLRTIVYGGGPMYLADLDQRDGGLRQPPRADLRPGREPDDDHGALQVPPCRSRASAAPPAPGFRRLAPQRGAGVRSAPRKAMRWPPARWARCACAATW